MTTIDLKYIKQRRVLLNLSMKDMAERMGFKNASTYLKYENGTYSFKANQLPLLAELLQCDIANFFDLNVAKNAI